MLLLLLFDVNFVFLSGAASRDKGEVSIEKTNLTHCRLYELPQTIYILEESVSIKPRFSFSNL